MTMLIKFTFDTNDVALVTSTIQKVLKLTDFGVDHMLAHGLIFHEYSADQLKLVGKLLTSLDEVMSVEYRITAYKPSPSPIDLEDYLV